jgi:hypothetical protein
MCYSNWHFDGVRLYAEIFAIMQEIILAGIILGIVARVVLGPDYRKFYAIGIEICIFLIILLSIRKELNFHLLTINHVL